MAQKSASVKTSRMDDRRDPLLGLPIRSLEGNGSFDGEDDDGDNFGLANDHNVADDSEGDNHHVHVESDEQSDEDDVADKLFPSDFTEDYTQIDAGQPYGTPGGIVGPTQEDSPTLLGLQAPAGNGLLPQPLASKSEEHGLLPGETLQLKVTDAVFVPDRLAGTLLVTSYRLQFTPNGTHPTWRAGDFFKLPVTTILKITRKAAVPSDELMITCKDGRDHLLFKFASEHIAKRAHSLLLTLAFPVSQGVGVRWFFCFSQPHKTEFKTIASSLATSSPEQFDESRFRETEVNWEFSLCPSYPRKFLVPKHVPDTQLKQIAQFRSKGRIPALSWFDRREPNRGGTLWRCSQPKVGFASFSVEDEGLFEAIRKGTASGTIVIVDCRSAMAAMANKARGMGTEDVTRYRGTKMQFENIANYHSVRSSFDSLRKLLSKHLAKRDEFVDETFFVDVENTKWLYHLRTILATSIKVAEAAAGHHHAVVVHCSDGWDRTSQITALAQVLMNPECRTRKGFVRMIHREWISFGHKFKDRLGVGIDADDNEERAPIFIQFLDCVWQLKRLFPKQFEFNTKFLEMLAYHAYSSRFVEFMGNTVLEWEQALESESGATSLWDLLLNDDRSSMTFDEDGIEARSEGMLLPRISVICRQVILWDVFLARSAVPSSAEQAFDSVKPDMDEWEWWM